jgi:hypothetical protein
MLCHISKVNRHFRGTCCFHLQGWRVNKEGSKAAAYLMLVSCLAYSWTLKMEVIYSSETVVDYWQTTWRYVGSTPSQLLSLIFHPKDKHREPDENKEESFTLYSNRGHESCFYHITTRCTCIFIYLITYVYVKVISYSELQFYICLLVFYYYYCCCYYLPNIRNGLFNSSTD